MSKTLYLVRHAKSSWDDPSINDIDRPLNERGKTDAPAMAKKLAEQNMEIDAFISSPAKRARQTCNRFIREFGKKKEKIVIEDQLYEAADENFYAVVESLKNKWKSVALFSHNPGITSFANSLTETHIDDMPTCSIFAVTIDADKWKDFRDAKKAFLFFEFPKMF